jgi:hypothetical protein
MASHSILRTRAAAVAACAIALSVAFGTGAFAASKITSADIKDHTIQGKDIKNGAVGSPQLANGGVKHDDLAGGSVQSNNLKDGTVGSKDLANGSVTAGKLAPGAVAFPNSLWGPVLRNQKGAARSNLQTGPGTVPMGKGSLALITTGTNDLAAFGDSFDFAGFPLDSITNLSYSSYNNDTTPAVRPSLRIEIDPHLIDDSSPGGLTEFTTLTYEPDPGAQGWVTHANIQNDPNWYLTGTEGTEIGCTQASMCTLAALTTALDGHADTDNAAPAISTGVYFGLGSGIAAPTETAVDKFVFNNFVFDFEPNGVFMTPAP